MPAFEILGPLQISFARMLGDIVRFMVLFFLVGIILYIMTSISYLDNFMRFSLFMIHYPSCQVLLAFMVGLHNLYWYYGARQVLIDQKFKISAEPFEGYNNLKLLLSLLNEEGLKTGPVRTSLIIPR